MLPFIRISDDFAIPTYILVLSLTYTLGLIWADRRAGNKNLSRGIALDTTLAIMIGGFIGARLTHVFYEFPSHYLANPVDIIKFWNGGFVYYGGFMGAALAAFWYLRRKGESFLFWADFFTPILSFGYAAGRIGCFLNGCCYGKVCDLPWAVEFHNLGAAVGARHPTQLYATFTEAILLILVLWWERRATFHKQGQLFLTWLTLHALSRIGMEYFRDDFRGPELGLSISTWLSLLLITAALLAYKQIHRGNR